MPTIEIIVQERCRELIGGVHEAEVPLDMHRRLVEEYGFSSLQLITLLTNICEESALPLTALTERDIATIKTPQDIVNVVTHALATGGPS